jgi:hypothetical protein
MSVWHTNAARRRMGLLALCSLAGCALAPGGIDLESFDPDLDASAFGGAHDSGHDLWRPEAGAGDAGSELDADSDPPLDAGTSDARAPSDGAAEASTEDAGPVPADDAGPQIIDADTGPAPDAGPEDSGPAPVDASEAGTTPVNCAPLVASGVQLCDSAQDQCGAVFTNSNGCTAVCAAAGLTCALAYENVEGQCAADMTRPALPCDSGHQSDYCVCKP